MSHPGGDRIKELSNSSGTGSFVLTGAVSGEPVRAFSSAEDGKHIRYVAKHITALEAESGYGVYTHSTRTLTRLYRYYPTKGGPAVSFSAGGVHVACTPITGDFVPNEATIDPAVTDDVDAGFLMGMEWLNTATPSVWKCVDHSAGAAVWVRIDLGGTSAVNSVNGRIGTVVLDAADIGSALSPSNYTPVGSPGTGVEAHLSGIDTALGALSGGIAFTEIDDAGDYSATSFKVGADGASKNEQRRFTGNQNHLIEFIAGNLADGDYGWLIRGGTGTVTLKYNNIALNGGTDDIPLKSKVKWTVHEGGVLLDGGTGEDVDMDGVVVHGNLAMVVTRGAGSTQPTVNDSGAWITTDGNITIPNTEGWHCTLEFGGAHNVVHNSLTWTSGAGAGDIVSVMVKPSNAIRITPLIDALDVITESDFA